MAKSGLRLLLQRIGTEYSIVSQITANREKLLYLVLNARLFSCLLKDFIG